MTAPSWWRWATVMALVDVLLHLVWGQTLKQDREELFARIAADFALDPDACAFTPWDHNYGSLLILAWLFDDLDGRLPVSCDLGVRLSPVGARSVIAAEHARTRPDYYRRLAWKRRGKKWRIRSQRSASDDAHAPVVGTVSETRHTAVLTRC